MSVDIFGRRLVTGGSKNSPSISRGAPGPGFRFTDDGQFDIEYKRLCKVGDCIDDDDAITLKMVKNIVKQEISLIYKITSSLRTEIDTHDAIIGGFIREHKDFIEKLRFNNNTA